MSHPKRFFEQTVQGTSQSEAAIVAVNSASVFDFTDYRLFLTHAFDAKKSRNPSYTESAFCRRAGLGLNSRGYFKLIVQGKRNLTPNTIRGFADALGLSPRETLYFENLVYYNQAKKPKDREYYFGRLSASAEGNESEAFLLLKSQHTYYSHWYMVAVRQAVGLTDFREDPTWISRKLRNKVTPDEVIEALNHLERIGLLKRDENNQLIQSQPNVRYPGGTFSYTHRKFQGEMLDRAKESLFEDDYEERYISSATITCDRAQMEELKALINRFRDDAAVSVAGKSKEPNTIFQLGIELFQLTPAEKKTQETKQKETKK